MNSIDYSSMPRLELRHANVRETGSAVRMWLVPSASGREGHIRLSAAPQVGAERFDWDGAVTVDLGAVDLAKLLMVFSGWIEKTAHDSVGDNTIHHTLPDGNIVTVDFEHRVEPGPMYYLTVTRHRLHEGKDIVQIGLSPAEAVAVDESVKSAMHRIAFGDTILCMGMDIAGEAK